MTNLRTFFFVALSLLPLAARADILKYAQSEYAAAQAEYARVAEDSQKKVLRQREKLAATYAEIDAKTRAVGLLKSRLDAAKNLREKSGFYAAVKSELAAELRRINASVAAVSAGEILAAAQSEIGARFDALKNPARRTDAEVVALRSREKLSGRTFRIGAFTYFAGANTAGFVDANGVLYGEKFAPEISAFASGKTDILPADTSGGEILKAEKYARTMAEEIDKGGVWIYPILALGAAALLAAFGKIVQLYFLRRARSPEAACGGDSLGSPFAELARAVDSAKSSEEAETAAYAILARENAKLKSWLPVFAITSTASPLFGLLGTVSGIIKTFADLSASGADTRAISDGIAEALITTEYGLAVAIPALIVGTVLSRRVRAVFEKYREFADFRISASK